MAQWTSKDAILRDLRRAQGGAGAGRPEPRPLLAAERPPRLRLTEENEEEFFRHCVGDGGVGDKPDLGLIQQMLDMVRNLNVSEEEVRATDAAVISKLNPVSAEFVPAAAAATAAPPLDTQPPARKTKRVRQRNVALESIFRAIESRKPSGEAPSAGEPPSLLKPEDLVPNVDVDDKVKSEAVEKVNDWMSQMSKPIKDKPVAVVLDSYNMFKKKVKPERSRASAGAGDAGAGAGSGTGGAGGAGGGAYVPSTHAEALYVAYVQRGRREEEAAARRLDVWTRAQAQMKRIDHNKRVEAAQQSVEAEAALKVVPEVVAATLAAVMPAAEDAAAATPVAEDAEDDSEASSATMETVSSASSFTDLLQCKILNASWQHVRLPRHRHRLRAPCAVCAARHAPPVPPAAPPAPPVPPVPPATPPGPRADLACNTI